MHAHDMHTHTYSLPISSLPPSLSPSHSPTLPPSLSPSLPLSLPLQHTHTSDKELVSGWHSPLFQRSDGAQLWCAAGGRVGAGEVRDEGAGHTMEEVRLCVCVCVCVFVLTFL